MTPIFDGWPKCACGEPRLDGHLTCGRSTCSESEARDRDRQLAGAVVVALKDGRLIDVGGLSGEETVQRLLSLGVKQADIDATFHRVARSWDSLVH